jgi:hypothetical protein
MIRERIVKLFCCKAKSFWDPVEMDAAENKVLSTVSRDQILHIAGKALVEIEVSIP